MKLIYAIHKFLRDLGSGQVFNLSELCKEDGRQTKHTRELASSLPSRGAMCVRGDVEPPGPQLAEPQINQLERGLSC